VNLDKYRVVDLSCGPGSTPTILGYFPTRFNADSLARDVIDGRYRIENKFGHVEVHTQDTDESWYAVYSVTTMQEGRR
jgi:hypothetical protein